MKKKKKIRWRIVNKQRFSFAVLILLFTICFSCISLARSFYIKVKDLKTNEIILENIIDNQINEIDNIEEIIENNDIKEEKTIEQLVAEVEQGLAGDGDARIEYLGDKYDEVMKIINEKYPPEEPAPTPVINNQSQEKEPEEEEEEEVTVVIEGGSKADYQEYAYDQVINHGWSDYDFNCLVNLWNRESGWNPDAHNRYSGAHGIPQALPASKMAAFGDDYYTNGYTQIDWGISYIANRYGSPANAWAHFQSHNWY